MQRVMNWVLLLLKWPLAVLMLFMIVPALKTDVLVLYNGLTLQILGWFFVPLLLMMALWLLVPGLGASTLAIWEHEVTHMLFALLTLHSPQDINIRRGVGGNFIYKGRGNWLIFVAPYFFPTSAIFAIGIIEFYLLAGVSVPIGCLLFLGLMTGFHLISTLGEIHPGQTDFLAAGYIFSLLFLPGANLIVYGMLMAYACYGLSGCSTYLQVLLEQSFLFLSLLSV